MPAGVAIIGCGLIGRKRAAALGDARLVSCADIDVARAREVARLSERFHPGHTVFASDDWAAAILHPSVDIVVVATTNDALAPVACFALDAGRHVLLEKPGARNARELETVIAAAARSGRLVRVGFNHRYHGAMLQAREIAGSGALGEMMFVRGRYGHGGRLGYDKEWRADPRRSGGGELLDQGVHLIDLARWFLGDFTTVEGFAGTFFWTMPVDDNAFLTLRTAGGQTAFLHASCSEWKNLFSLEIYGRQGKLHINGLGGSYGPESLVHYRMRPEMGPPEAATWEFPAPDRSWELEFADFLDDIARGRAPSAGLEAARAALVVVGEIYARSGYDFPLS